MKNSDSQLSKLTELAKTLSVTHGKVTLVFGRKADFYTDVRRTTLHHGAASLIGRVMIGLLRKSGFPVSEIDAVGGPTMGADPMASAMLHAVATQELDLGAFVVREVAKDHGMERQVEGPEMAGKRMVVLEDTSTIGGLPSRAADTLEAAGAKAAVVVVTVDYGTGIQQQIEEVGYPYFAALHLTDLGLF